MSQAYGSTEFGIGGAWLAEYTLQALDAGVLYFDATARIVQWNSAAARLFGVPEEQLGGAGLDSSQWEATTLDGFRLTADDNPVRHALDAGEPVESETLVIHHVDGNDAWLSLTALPVFGADRCVRGVLASVVPIAGSARISDILSAAVHCGRAAFEQSATAYVVVERSGLIVDWNRSMSAMIQRPNDDLTGVRLSEICDVDLDGVWLDGGTIGGPGVAVHVRTRAGAAIPTTAHLTLVDWPGNGRAVMIQLLERAVLPSADGGPGTPAELDAYWSVKVAIVTTTRDGTIVGINEAAIELLGAHRSPIEGRALQEFVRFVPTDEPSATVADAMQSSTPVSLGVCSVRTGSGTGVVKQMYGSRASIETLLLVQLAEVSLEALAQIANRSVDRAADKPSSARRAPQRDVFG